MTRDRIIAFWRSSPDRLSTTHEPTMTRSSGTLRQVAGEDGQKIGGHHPDTIRDKLWPWLIERGYATKPDSPLLEPFLDRVAKRNRDVHLRPGLSLMRRWEREKVDEPASGASLQARSAPPSISSLRRWVTRRCRHER